MTQELDLQAQLVEIFKANGGWGMKMAHAYNKGIPDLLLMSTASRLLRGPVFLEIKRMELPKSTGVVPITPAQLETLSLYTDMKTQCGIGIFFKEEDEWQFSVHPVRRGLNKFNGVKVRRDFLEEVSVPLRYAKHQFKDFVCWMGLRIYADPLDEEHSGLTYYTKKVSEKRKEREIWKIR